MTFAETYNNNKLFDIDTTKYNFAKLSELYTKDNTKQYVLNGFWCNESKYGKQTILIVSKEKKLVNLPMYLTKTFEIIQSDLDAINAIKEGKVGFTIYPYEKNKRIFYSIKFIDL